MLLKVAINGRRMPGEHPAIPIAPSQQAHQAAIAITAGAGAVHVHPRDSNISLFDYICVSALLEDRVIEYVDHLHDHFVDPVVIRNGHYVPPKKPGYSVTMWPETLEQFEFPNGSAWK
jgi:L-fuconate dehydratase